jgi:PAS domain S-box-containing protein
MFGYSAPEAIGRNISLIIPAELQAEEVTILQKLRKGQHIDHFETVRLRKDGTRIDISLSVSPVRNKAGQIIGASKIARDISERKRQQQNLQFLSNASRLLSSSLDYKMTLQTIARLAIPYVADWCSIDMLADDGSIEQLVLAHADPQKVRWAEEIRNKYPINLNCAQWHSPGPAHGCC